MVHDARAVANFLLDEGDALGLHQSNLSLQKIVYFCHVWSLIELDKPLIKQNFEAWEYGPVVPYLYREFKSFGSGPIKGRARKLDPATGRTELATSDFESCTAELIRKVIRFYGRLPSSMLAQLTHAPGGPWDKVWHARSVNPGMQIENRDIQRFYSSIPSPLVLQ